jgi:hypothetical protein
LRSPTAGEPESKKEYAAPTAERLGSIRDLTLMPGANPGKEHGMNPKTSAL